MIPPCVWIASFLVIILMQQTVSRGVVIHRIVTGEKEPHCTSHMNSESNEEREAKSLQQHCVCVQCLLLGS